MFASQMRLVSSFSPLDLSALPAPPETQSSPAAGIIYTRYRPLVAAPAQAATSPTPLYPARVAVPPSAFGWRSSNAVTFWSRRLRRWMKTRTPPHPACSSPISWIPTAGRPSSFSSAAPRVAHRPDRSDSRGRTANRWSCCWHRLRLKQFLEEETPARRCASGATTRSESGNREGG